MEQLLQQIASLFIAPPGNLIYYMVLAFSIAAAFQAAIMSRRLGAEPAAFRRLAVGLGLLLACQVALFFASAIAWQGLANPRLLLPPLDRAVTGLGVLCLAWLWGFPRPSRRADAVFIVLTVAVIIAFFLTYSTWPVYPAGSNFSGTLLDWAWELGMVVALLGGLLALLLIRPAGWPLGAGMLLLNLAGHAIQLTWPAAGADFSGAVRLAQMCSFPLLPALAQRLPVYPAGIPPAPEKALSNSALLAAAKSALKTPEGAIRERRRYSADPRTVFDWLQLAVRRPPEPIYQEVCRAFARTLLADVCLLARPTASGAQVIAVYDLVREEFGAPLDLPSASFPQVCNALQKGRSLRSGAEAGPLPELAELGRLLNLEKTGSMMLIPLTIPPYTWGGVLLLTPYSERAWTSDDQTYLLSSIESVVKALQQAESRAGPAVISSPTPADSPADVRLTQLETENQRMRSELESHRRAAPTELQSLAALQQEAETTIAALQAENESLRAALHSTGAAAQPLADTARLQSALEEANQKLQDLQTGAGESAQFAPSPEDREVVSALIQELRQPMASISGYTDLLMAESAGILGALQRKFLERVKSSIERMNAILNDLNQVFAMQAGLGDLVPTPVNAGVLIDEAVATVSSQLREKSISLRVDLPDELPEIQADRDALGQILRSLLQNACAATPVDGVITIRAYTRTPNPLQPDFHLEIQDSGGGIEEADLPRVFARRYRADNALIQGVGDSGVGLSIARTLVEAQNGKIWVESIPGEGSTFHVSLPLQSTAALAGQPE